MSLEDKYPLKNKDKVLICLIARIIDLRAEKGLTRRDVATQSRISEARLKRIEELRETPSLRKLIEIVEVLGGEISIN